MRPSIWSTKGNAGLDEGESGWSQDSCGPNITYDASPYQAETNSLNPNKTRVYF